MRVKQQMDVLFGTQIQYRTQCLYWTTRPFYVSSKLIQFFRFTLSSRFLSQLIDKKGFGLYSVLCLTFTTVRLETLHCLKKSHIIFLYWNPNFLLHFILVCWPKVAALFCTFQSMKNANPQRTLYPHLFSLAISCSGRLRERSKNYYKRACKKIRLNSLVQWSRATG